MLKSQSITFKNIVAPSDVTPEQKKAIEAIKEISIFYAAITGIIQYEEFTEVKYLTPFSQYSDLPNQQELSICVASKLEDIHAEIEAKEAAIKQLFDEAKAADMKKFERQAELTKSLADKVKATKDNITSKPAIIKSSNGFKPN